MNDRKLKITLFVIMVVLLGLGIYTARLDNGPKKQKLIQINLV